MMDLILKYKNVLIALIVIGAGFFAYTTFVTPDGSVPLTVESVTAEESAASQELIGLLVELRTIQLDVSVFDDPEFQSLFDFSQELVPEPLGRQNPFEPL